LVDAKNDNKMQIVINEIMQDKIYLDTEMNVQVAPAQQAGPFVETINMRIGANLPVPRFHYAVRICPEPVHWGGLSGCTYSEGVSWGKFVSPEEGGRFAEVHCDATIAWPILVRAVIESRS